MTFAEGRLNSSGSAQTVDVKVTIPEIDTGSAFWIRGYATHHTFAELYQECINHPEALRAKAALERVRASRHFWCGERMMRRDQSLHTLDAGSGGGAGERREISLALRRDFYRVGPQKLLAGTSEYAYLDAEDQIGSVLTKILSHEEKPCCFDLYDWRKRRLDGGKSLADYDLWPAWEEAEEFAGRAALWLRPRTGWLAYAMLAVAAIGGVGTGYELWRVLAER